MNIFNTFFEFFFSANLLITQQSSQQFVPATLINSQTSDHSSDQTTNQLDVSDSALSNDSANAPARTLARTPLNCDQMDLSVVLKTEPQFIFNNSGANANELQHIIECTDSSILSSTQNASLDASRNDEPDEEANEAIEEDCIMIGDFIPPPIQATNVGMIKREADIISANIAFINTVCNCILKN